MNTLNRILIVDDEQSMRELLSIMVRKEGYEVVTAENGEVALKAIQSDIFDLMITDIKMPRFDGMSLLKALKETAPDTIVIMITAFGTSEGAEQARSLGAYDYIGKPFNNDEIKLVIQNALEKRHLRKQNILLKREFESRAAFEHFIGKSEPMQRIFSLIRQVADTRSTVLISGESGTHYSIPYGAFATEVDRAVDAAEHTVSYYMNDTVHPKDAGHATAATLLQAACPTLFSGAQESVTLPARLYALSADYENEPIIRDGTDNDGETGTGWVTTDGTHRESSTADDTITYTGTFQMIIRDFQIKTGVISTKIDNEDWFNTDIGADGSNYRTHWIGTRGVHTVIFKVVTVRWNYGDFRQYNSIL